MISYNRWKKEFEMMVPDNARIGSELYLLHYSKLPYFSVGPFKSDISIAIIVKNGHIDFFIDMKHYHVQSPSMFIILPGQIFRVGDVSEDLNATTIMMSENLTNNLFNEYSAFNQLGQTILQNPLVLLNGKQMNAYDTYIQLLDNILKSNIHYKFEATKHLTLSMFYGMSFDIHNTDNEKKPNKQNMLFHRFEELLKNNYMKQREVVFYAEHLCVSAKHLSVVIKKNTGKSAIQCINEFVANECQSMLLSSNMTLQEIAYKLNFPSQSVFSKFFKRMTKMSPREYRKHTN